MRTGRHYDWVIGILYGFPACGAIISQGRRGRLLRRRSFGGEGAPGLPFDESVEQLVLYFELQSRFYFAGCESAGSGRASSRGVCGSRKVGEPFCRGLGITVDIRLAWVNENEQVGDPLRLRHAFPVEKVRHILR